MADIKLDKKDVKKACLFWWLTSHSTYNYQRLQAGPMAGMMGPILDKLYKGDKEKVSEGLTRHMLYFNTEPRWGAILPGMTVALEETLANDTTGEMDGAVITDIKTAMMGPLAGIGDTIWAGLIKPVILSIILAWAMQGVVGAAWIWGVGVMLLDFAVTYIMFHKGYELGLNSVDKFLDGGFIKKITTFLGIVGMFSLGAMIVKYISVQVVLSVAMTTTTLEFGSILNRIIPCFVPLSLTLLAYWLQKKGKSVTFVLLVLFAIGFVGGALGILG